MLCGLISGCGNTGAVENSPVQEAESTGTEAEAQTENEAKNETGAGTGTESVQRDVINVGIDADLGDLSPWGALNTGRTATAQNLYQPLAHVNDDGEIVGVLIKDYELAEDESYMDCHLYDYIYDSDGNHLTASDVVFSFDTCRELGNVGGIGFVKSSEVVDDYTVRFNFSDQLYVYDIETLFEELPIVTQAAYEGSPDGMSSMPVSTSPYKVTEYTAGYILTLEKRDDYWQTDESLIHERDQANVDKINFYILTESTQMSLALENGSIDMSWSVSTDDLERFEQSDDFWLFDSPDDLCIELFQNFAEGHPTTDVNLRKAIYYAVNSEAILQSVYKGKAILNYDTAASKAPDFQDAWATADNYYQYDLEKAKEYLEAWGGDPSSLNLQILASNDEANSNIAQLIQGFLGQIGISSEIRIADSANFNTIAYDSDQWDVLVTNKATSNYCVTNWKNCFSKDYFTWGGTINFAYDDELQKLVNTARTESTHNEETVSAVHEYIIDNAYGYGVVNLVNHYVIPSCINNVVCSYKGAVMPGACTYTE
ncbi:MAG: ABC transporter substrate-binding protein, partial [Lachnospiraceae bacterium]|nr:ABC transporter substrate-binding protein [Lachnospiraceae bacterium]